jgi:membrane-associated phospholipid phosphatase
VHYPTDVVAGALLGAGVAALTQRVAHRRTDHQRTTHQRTTHQRTTHQGNTERSPR